MTKLKLFSGNRRTPDNQSPKSHHGIYSETSTQKPFFQGVDFSVTLHQLSTPLHCWGEERQCQVARQAVWHRMQRPEVLPFSSSTLASVQQMLRKSLPLHQGLEECCSLYPRDIHSESTCLGRTGKRLLFEIGQHSGQNPRMFSKVLILP